MPRHNLLRFPSYKNLQIYHRFAYERRTQTALAKELGLSQRRVSQIAQQVKSLVDLQVPPRHYLGQDGLRFHLAIAHERLRLKESYEPLVAMFTGPDGDPCYLRRYITVVNGQPLHTVEVSEKPDLRLLNQATSVVGRLAQLEAIAKVGPFAGLPDQIDQTITHSFQPDHLPLPLGAGYPRRSRGSRGEGSGIGSNTSTNPSNSSNLAPATMPTTSKAPSNLFSNTSENPSNGAENQPLGLLPETLVSP